MPWHLEDDNADCNGWAVVVDDTGEVVGCHPTRREAQQHLEALYANVEHSERGRSTMRTKTCRIEIKDADQGLVAAVFSTFNVIDADRDVTRPKAFEEGASVRISAYGHSSWMGELPVGKGTLRQTKTEAIMDGQFFLNTTSGQDTFTVVKEMGDLQEWSYGYDPIEYSYGEFEDQRVRFLDKLKVHEVSPVLLGAGVGTRTLMAKSARGDMTLTEEAEAVVADLDLLLKRAADVMAKRSEKGKRIGVESAELLGQIEEHLKALDTLLRAPDPQAEMTKEFLRVVARQLTSA
jgi:hypothetical protein